MYLAERLRQLRESKNLSQGDIEKRTGLLRCYISRVENGHTVPAIETIEKLARALETPMYQLFYEGEEQPQIFRPSKDRRDDWASRGKGLRIFTKIQRALPCMTEEGRALLLYMAGKMVNGKRNKSS
jgi:transcriptional regulator with XRE-family HTH domain